MKRFMLIAACCLIFAACSDESLEMEEPARMSYKAAPCVTSPSFEWEDVSNILLEGINGNVTLPWYPAASTAIPRYILDNNKKADGWFMVYNTCSPSDFCEPYKYYLFFYNVFTGLMRGYVYNPYTVQSADHTFWQISFNQPTKLLNTYGKYALPHEMSSSLEAITVSNVSTSPVKAMTKGWNCFEIDMSEYDCELDKSQLNFSVVAYDVNNSNVVLDGVVGLETEGQILAQTKEASKKDNYIYAAGKAATALIDGLIKENKVGNSNTQSRSVVLGALWEAGKFLINKFTSKGTQPQNYDLRTSTKGTLSINGEITSMQNSNILPISGLSVPGNQINMNGAFLPSFDGSVGVWTLEREPVVNFVSYTLNWVVEKPDLPILTGINNPDSVSTNDISPIMPGGKIITTKIVKAKIDSIESLVRINPDVLQYIDKYEVGVDVVENAAKGGYLGNSSSLLGSTTDTRTLVYDNGYDRIVRWNGYEMFRSKKTTGGYGGYTGPFILGLPSDYAGMPEVKVTVVLYPKAPFNTTPVVLMRTYLARKVFNQDMAEDVIIPIH